MLHPSTVSTFTFSTDSSLLVSAGYKSVYVWNVGEGHSSDNKGQLNVKLTRHSDFVTVAEFVLDSQFLVTGGFDKNIVIWSMKTKTAICSYRTHCQINIGSMIVANNLSSISFLPGAAANLAVLTLNKAAKRALSGIPDKPVAPPVQKAQSVALTFSTKEVTTKTSVACSIL